MSDDQEHESGSLAHAVAQRRREREAARGRIITVPIPGYEDLFAVKYRRLQGSEKREIVARHNLDDPVANEAVLSLVDTLINACVDIVQITGEDENGEPVYTSLGKRWAPHILAELFEDEDLKGMTVRAGLMQVFDEEELVQHFNSYRLEVDALYTAHREAAPGESRLSDES